MKKEGLREKLHYVKLGILASVPEGIAFSNALVVQAKESTETTTGNSVVANVDKASVNSYGVIKGICMALLLIVVAVSGLILVIGTQKMKETIKENFYSIVVGCALLFMAGEITDWLESIFS